ncbi:MAG: FAD:protein FMN transferase [Chitinophagales bacterium]|nr:FAD:protein FMN transferase [Chitinophagales bacterium]
MKKLLFFLLVLLLACKQSAKQYAAEIHFETMGTWGTVKLVSDAPIQDTELVQAIDSILVDVNMGLSTYIDSSIISRTNRTGYWMEEGEELHQKHFERNLTRSLEIMNATQGAFNVFIKPLVDFWGFGAFDQRNLAAKDSMSIDSILQCMAAIDILVRDTSGCLQLDFSAIAKGYGVDQVAYYLDSLGISNYMVEIGGEVNCKGKNAEGIYWRLGIEEPNEEERAIYEIVSINNKSMATSGNYRNFKVLENGQKIVHIINPRTGYPEMSNLLSASILADDCMTADAYATACMVMGLDSCYEFVIRHPELECYLIYSDAEGNLQNKYSAGFNALLEKE